VNNDSKEVAYNTKEITDMLKIGSSTLRKWCLALEEQGYIFTKVEQNKRLFLDKDLILLKHFQKLVQENKLQLEQASKVVISRFSAVEDEPFSQVTTSVPAVKDEVFPARTTSVPVELLDFMEYQKQVNEEVLNQVKSLNSEILELKSQNNRYNSEFVKSMRTSMEQHKLEVATAIEQELSKKKIGFFARLFGKK
jgi:DNA-binding transcriptional MerR regulator